MAEKRRQLKSILGPATDLEGNPLSSNPEVLQQAEDEDILEFEAPKKEEKKPDLGEVVQKSTTKKEEDSKAPTKNPMAAPGLNKPKPGKGKGEGPPTVPDAYAQITSTWDTAVEKAMAPLNTQLEEIKTKLDTQLNKAEDVKSRNDWLELAETFGNALLKIGAANEGLKTGVDMSGTKFNKTDWNARTKNSLDIIQKRMDALAGEKAGVEAKAEKDVSRLDKLRAAAIRLQEAKDKRAQEAKLAATKDKQTPAQKKLEEAAGKTAEEWLSTGKANYKDNKKAVENTIALLGDEETKIGGLWGAVDPNTRLAGAGFLKLFNFKDTADAIAQGAEAELSIASVIQKSLRETLGGQFAEREGENVLKRSFAPGLPKETLKKNAERVLLRLEAAAAAKDEIARRVRAGERIDPEEIDRRVNAAYTKASKDHPLETATSQQAEAEPKLDDQMAAKRARLEELRRKRDGK